MTTKDKAVYIGSTPKNLTREANEIALKQFAKQSQQLKENLLKIRGKKQMSYS
ncbi:hypothetical protein B14_200136 (plasmid) [Bacillus licheniformis]|uniref:hypothetical protein n=1 Tax=Bacillus TaxID=1386 RepID=UPI0009C2B5B2|nr:MULTISPECIES: hypothetical protein [Bacillus]ARC67347.1 hypothetical protein B14_200136 [Bacillus licheniformis]ARW46243.1 hypothetical protein S100141_05025 [Bacillus licheniformis]MCY1628283.1 hypothetical protein [Bacillus paralicheniformis]MDE1421782.1 hypothetical protein [Bacillus licheniformis]MEC0475787.1 hypothetical protein [Bacillus licheniformis]